MPESVTLDHALDLAMQLPPEAREVLLDVLRRRKAEARRDEIAANAAAAREALEAGGLHPESADALLERLDAEAAEAPSPVVARSEATKQPR